jgi:mono/diheme cytochrome c family protein
VRASLGVLKNPNCFLSNALAELSSEKVLPFKNFGHGKEASNPGPNYIVWKNGDDREEKKKPWPWALVALHKEEMDDTLIRPKNPKLNAGYNLYKQHCIACHSINLVGGQVGFEMNIPKNITEYRTYEFFSSFVVAPESYRAQSKMPARKLPESELKAIWEYLKGKAGEKI